MKKNIMILGLVLLFAFLVFSSNHAIAQDPIVVRIATEVAIDFEQPINPSGPAILTLKDFLEGTGRFEVEIFPAMQLGDTKDLYSQVKRQDIHITTDASTGTAGAIEYEPLMIFEAPWLFPNGAIANRIMNTITRSDFMRRISDDMAEKTGVRPLHVFNSGPKVMSSSEKPILTPKDLENQTFRVLPAPYLEVLYSELGAEPVSISWSEIYSALETGVAEGMENAYFNYPDQSLQEVQDYFSETYHTYLTTTSLVNEEWFQSLSDEDRGLLLQGFEVYHDTYVGTIPVANQYSKDFLERNGAEIYSMTAEDRSKFEDIAREPVHDWFRDMLGEENIHWFNELEELANNLAGEEFSD